MITFTKDTFNHSPPKSMEMTAARACHDAHVSIITTTDTAQSHNERCMLPLFEVVCTAQLPRGFIIVCHMAWQDLIGRFLEGFPPQNTFHACARGSTYMFITHAQSSNAISDATQRDSARSAEKKRRNCCTKGNGNEK